MGGMTFDFVCRQKTAYEMRISDWSADVCSSDLSKTGPAAPHTTPGVGNCALEASLIHACVRQGEPSHVRCKAAFATGVGTPAVPHLRHPARLHGRRMWPGTPRRAATRRADSRNRARSITEVHCLPRDGIGDAPAAHARGYRAQDRKSTRLNSSH